MTLAYASPEQLSGQALSARSDIYSFGIHEVLTPTGRQPARDHDSIDCDALYVAPELLLGEKP